MIKFYSSTLTSDAVYKATLKGDIFQLKLLMAVALRASQTARSFVLNTEVVEAEKFDDLVVEYESTATVLQAKHSSKTANYAKKDFMKGYKGEASIAKYFDSFVRIKEKKLFGKKSVQYVFFTNRFISDDDFFSCLTSAAEPDGNLTFNTSDAKCWKFKRDFITQNEEYISIYTELVEAIKDNSLVYYQLLSRDLLIDISAQKKTLEDDVKKLIAKIVFEIKNLYKDGERSKFSINLSGRAGFTKERNLLISILEHVGEDTYAKFHPAFCEGAGLTVFQQYIRKELIDEVTRELNLSDEQVKELIDKVVLQFPKDLSAYSWMSKDKTVNAVAIVSNSVSKTLTWTPTKEKAYFLVGMFGEFKFKYEPEKEFPLSYLSIYRGLHKAIIATIQTTAGININAVEAKFSQHLKDFSRYFVLSQVNLMKINLNRFSVRN